ncbi:MAG TPA: hypothetical protein VNT60_09915, partial [Deinococcales bacterium]|nr:hypothetical protein [Deinococcales bacterium]
MTFDAARGRYRYVLTRPCIENGSITVLKYLEPVLPLEGSITFVADAGEEITATADQATRRITGLSDYYAKQKLGVNDLLFITRLGERRYQLEAHVKPKDEKPALQRPAMPAAPRRVVVEESPYVREVRQVRGPVSVPNLAAVNAPDPQPAEAAPQQAQPAEAREAVPVARAPREQARAADTERANPVARGFSDNLSGRGAGEAPAARGFSDPDGARPAPTPRIVERIDADAP